MFAKHHRIVTRRFRIEDRVPVVRPIAESTREIELLLRLTEKRESLYEFLRRPDVENAIPKPIRFKIDAMRVHGNRGAHGETVSAKTAIWALREVFDLGRLFIGAFQ